MSLSSKVVTVVGGGSVGSTLAKAILSSGKAKRVMIAARDPEKTKAKLPDLPVEAMTSAIEAADIIILATPSAASDQAIQAMAASLGNVSGKIVIDATNPVSDFQDGLQIRWTQGTSGGEILQEALPLAKIYKAFNTCGVEHMADAAGKDMLFCGPPGDDQDTVAQVTAAVGFKPYYVGPIRYSRNLEAMAELWIHCAIPPLPAANFGRDWTFSISGNPSV